MPAKKTVETVSDAISQLGGHKHVEACLGLDQSTISSWVVRKRVSRDYALHVLLSLKRRGLSVSPRVFGLESWDSLIIPRPRKKAKSRIA